MIVADQRPLAGILALAVAMVCLSQDARAQPSSEERVLAEALFRDGRALMEAERWDEACLKLEASHDIDPLAGVLLNMALCHEKQGRTATAWSEFREALALAKIDRRDDREQIAQEHADQLELELAKVIIEVSSEASALDGLALRREGATLVRASWGLAIPMDPGEHRILAEAPGHVAFEGRVVAVPRQVTTLVIPPLEPALEASPQSPRTPPAYTTPAPRAIAAPASPSPVQPDPGSNPWRTTGWIVGGVGAAAALLGAGFGVNALVQEGRASDTCTTTTCPDDDSLSASEAAENSALVADAALIAGATLVTGGLVLVLATSDDEAVVSLLPSWSVRRHFAGLAIQFGGLR